MMRVSRYLAGILLLLSFSACDNGLIAPSDWFERGSLGGSSRDLVMKRGEEKEIIPNLVATNGRAAKARIQWRSSDDAVATVDSEGVVRAVRAGRTEVVAFAANLRDTTRVTVTSGLEIEPESILLTWLGAKKQLSVSVADGEAPPVAWQSLSPATVSVDSMGMISAKAVGTALIVATAACCEQADTAQVQVWQAADSVFFSQKQFSLNAGQTVQLNPSVWDHGGSPIESPSLTWRTNNESVATVSNTGLVTARNSGNAIITASGDGGSDMVTIQVASDNPVVAGHVDLNLVRLDRGSGTVLVTGGVPLAPGMLWPGQEGNVRLLVGGKEQSIYAEVLHGRHRDGSARSVLIQLSYSLSSTPVAAQLVIGQARSTPMRAKADVSYTYERPMASAVPLPSSPQYLMTTELVMPTAGVPNVLNARYETRFVEQSDGRFANYLAAYEAGTTTGLGANYYDRVIGHVAYWVRSGNAEYLRRAYYYLIGYRELFLMPPSKNSPCQVDPRNHAIEGLELHYLLTGDHRSRECVQRMANHVASPGAWLGIMDTRPWDGRIKSRIILAMLTAWRLELPTLTRDSPDFAPLVREAVNRTIGYQGADGAYRYAVAGQEADGTNAQINYMTGLINESLAKVYDLFEQDPRILEAIRKSVDFMWETQWIPEEGAFPYATKDTKPARDLNMIIVHGFGWLYRVTGNSKYREQGNQIFDAGVRQTWFGNSSMSSGDKQFNQHYRSSYQFFYNTR